MKWRCRIENLVIPRVQDQQAYYSRQFYTYNFTLVENKPNGKLTKENVTSYTWTEGSYRKDSSACASAVFDALKKSDMSGIDTVRLCSDGCGGQNKNTGLIYMAGHWLRNYAPNNVKKVELVFPVRGHSFLPSDRVFGFIELDVKNKQSIYSPSEYHDIFAKHATVRKAGTDWPVLDFKKVADSVLKKPFPVGIQENKRFCIHKTAQNAIKVSGEVSYRNVINTPVLVTKAKKSFRADPSVVDKGHLLTEAKKKDVRSLMTAHCEEGWTDNNDERFNYMKEMIQGEHQRQHQHDDDQHDDEGEVCDCLDEDGATLTV
ncbi:4-diphosphocytidyl-2-c-methyl-d-erythritol kinase [Plakobranchus ocellatus]|uniref:4-diphosphocytidyl-2-c-methyl-d-erythritol kinase n=1 Tax=Plakobranchus ocellatus TaxID=259542 RepID=A0AAV4DC38_9GAST|nr:4-diphosphocytidyl-2-c-methyl-d-erythritol kinase [Plakobranchus ocellatus]